MGRPGFRPLVLGCRRLWRLGYRRGAWVAGIAPVAITVAAAPMTDLPGSLAIAVSAAVSGLPVWIGWRRLARWG